VGLILRKRHPGTAWVGLMDQSFDRGGRGRRGGATGTATATAGVRVPGLVNWGTPAFQAGLEEGDVVTAADGQLIATTDDWQNAVRAHKPGDSMAVEFNRHGTIRKATIAVAEDPTVEVVPLESTGATLSEDQRMMRDAWLSSKQR
ncbi:MAG: PDZ domain-containing protein, partial [Gemmatimonadaceae bacterium]